MYDFNKVKRDSESPPLSPSFKQNKGSFFQKQTSQSNKMALTPTKQRLIRASSITSMFDLNQLKDPAVFQNQASISAPKFDSRNDNDDESKQLNWIKPGHPFKVVLPVLL